MEGYESRQKIDALLKEVEEDMLINSSIDDISNNEEDDDYVQMLLEKEINNGFPWLICESARLALDNWLKYARWNVISWILRSRELLGLRFETAYLSVTYFDGFLARRMIDREQHYVVQLLSLACLSLATKIREEKTLTLIDFPMEEYQFDNKVIQRMELLVLNTLEWRMSLVTPFAYTRYLMKMFFEDPSTPNKTISRIAQLILATMKDVNLIGNRPSIIAVAATLVAMDPKLTKSSLDLKIKAFSPIGFLEINDVFPCYTRIQELDMPAIGNGSINNHF